MEATSRARAAGELRPPSPRRPPFCAALDFHPTRPRSSTLGALWWVRTQDDLCPRAQRCCGQLPSRSSSSSSSQIDPEQKRPPKKNAHTEKESPGLLTPKDRQLPSSLPRARSLSQLPRSSPLSFAEFVSPTLVHFLLARAPLPFPRMFLRRPEGCSFYFLAAWVAGTRHNTSSVAGVNCARSSNSSGSSFANQQTISAGVLKLSPCLPIRIIILQSVRIFIGRLFPQHHAYRE